MAFRDGVLVHSQAGAMPAAALEDLIARRRESRRRGERAATTLDTLASGLDVAATGTEGPWPQRASSRRQVSRAVQTRRESSSSTTIS